MAQVPSEHSGAAAPQRLPHAPQLALLACRLKQLPAPPRRPAHCVRPAAQSHVPFRQPPPPGQMVPQAPQFVLFVKVSTHAVAPRRPAGHDVKPPSPQPGVHIPPEQDVPAPQRAPHAPQLALSACGLTQVTPHCRSGEQLQTPPTQLAPFAHWWPHVAQLSGSVDTSTQLLLQFVSATPAALVPHKRVHAPFEQTGVVAGHTLAHAPQLFGSLCVCVHTPLHRKPPLAQRHCPPWHAVPAAQRVPHEPQLVSLVVKSTHALPHWVPPATEQTHAPAVQTVPPPQTRPQAPQLFGSL
jgi:hypothetical protein